MTLQHGLTDAGRHYTQPEHTPRLRLKPKAPRSGYVDGAWWPHSTDLAAELPDLLTVLSVRLGPIDRVMYNVDEWAQTSAKLVSGGRAVRLDGYGRQPINTIEVIGHRNRIVLLVVPSNTNPDDAHTTLMAAAAPSDDSTVDGLLMITPQDREVRTQAADAQKRWGSEGKRQPAAR